jgi:hypothetical protein
MASCRVAQDALELMFFLSSWDYRGVLPWLSIVAQAGLERSYLSLQGAGITDVGDQVQLGLLCSINLYLFSLLMERLPITQHCDV